MQKLALVHIPKTAGTTLRRAFEIGLGPSKVFTIGVNCSAQDWQQKITSEHLNQYSVVAGHSDVHGFERLGIPFTYASLVRDPILRAASFYNYVMIRRVGDALHQRIVGKTLEEAIEVPAFQNQVRNAQCRILGGSESAVAALERISSPDFLVMSETDIPFMLREISERFGWPLSEPKRANVGTPGYLNEILTPAAIGRIEALNREDIALVKAIAANSPKSSR